MHTAETFRLHLQRELVERCKRNPRYSLRSYAKALKINHGALSQILRGTRPLTLKTMVRLGGSLGMGPAEMAPYLASAQAAAGAVAGQDYAQLSLDAFAAISDWHHDAILELVAVKGFQGDSRWIARRLGISPSEAHIAVERLERLGLLELGQDGRWSNRAGSTTTIVGNDFTAVAFRKLQKQLLELSIRKLESVPKALREHCSMAMALDPADLSEAKQRIKVFRRELCAFLQRKGSRPTEVYQLAVGLFPLTEIESEGEAV